MLIRALRYALTDLLEKTSKLRCRGDQLDDRVLGSIPECMLRAAWDFDEISRPSRNPVTLSILLAEHLNVPGKNIEGLDRLVAMYGYRNARGNYSFYNTRSFIVCLRRNQKLNARSQHVKALAIRFDYETSRWLDLS